MESRLYSLRANRPYQKAGTSIEVYYHQFCHWKDEICREGCQYSEKSFVDDFIVRMTWDILVRMYRYPSPPFSLSDAFRRAQFEESIISLEELTRKVRADKVFEEMSHPISINTAETQGDEDVPDYNIQDVLGVPGFADDNFQLHLKSNELHLNIINPWSESEIKQAYLEGNLTDEAKKDEQSQAYKLVSRDIIYPMNAQVIKPLITIAALTCIGAQNNRWSILMEEGLYSYKLCLSRGKNLAESRGCKDGISLIDNDVMFLFDPGGCTLSKMKLESSKFYGDQGGLCLAFALAPNFIDALVNAISHKPWIREAYGYGDVIEYSGTKKEFVGKGSAQNALTPWFAIDRDYEGRKIHHVILRDFLDSFVVIPPINVCVCVVDWCVHVACGLALQLMFDMLLAFSHFQVSVSSAQYNLTSSATDDTLRKLVLQGPGHCIFLEHVKRIHRALESDDVALVWMMLCNVSRVEEIRGLFCDTMIMDGKYDADQESHSSEYLIYKFSVTENVCYLFDPGGSYFFFIIWNWEICHFPHGSGIATTVWILKCSKRKFNTITQSGVTRITVDKIHSGVFITFSKIRGQWGVFNTLEKWVSGAYAGHTVVGLRDSDRKLYVGESGHETDEGEYIIAVLPWDEWREFELTKDGANLLIVLLPLRPGLSAKFNETSAWEYARSMSGRPYGYNNLIFIRIDTLDGNYSPPLDTHCIAYIMTVFNGMQPAYAANIRKVAWNKRTHWLGFLKVLVEVAKHGLSFGEPLAIPVRDDWVYIDGQSISCAASVLEMYKEAGLFGQLANPIIVTELTVKDDFEWEEVIADINSSSQNMTCRYRNISLSTFLGGDSITAMISCSNGMPHLRPISINRTSCWGQSMTCHVLNVFDAVGFFIGVVTNSYANDNEQKDVYDNIIGIVSPNVILLINDGDFGKGMRILVDAIVTAISIGDAKLGNYVWDPGLSMLWITPILEDKDVLKGKDLSGSKGFEGISYFVLFIKLFTVLCNYDISNNLMMSYDEVSLIRRLELEYKQG